MLGRGYREHAVDQPVPQAFDGPLAHRGWQHLRAGQIPGQLDARVGRVDALATRTTGPGETPGKLSRRNGQPVIHSYVVRHAASMPSAAAGRHAAGRGRRQAILGAVTSQPTPVATTGYPWPIESTRLANGLRVVVSEDRSAPVVCVNLW